MIARSTRCKRCLIVESLLIDRDRNDEIEVHTCMSDENMNNERMLKTKREKSEHIRR